MKVPYQKRLSRLHVEGPLAPFLLPYMAHLAEQGFAQISIWRKTFLLGEFSQWLKQRQVSAEHITADHPRAFLHDRARSHHVTPGHLLALKTLLSWLQNVGAIARPAKTSDLSQTERLLQEYSTYLRQERGLEPSTIKRYTLVVQRFLQRTPPHGPHARLSALKAQDVCDFVRQYVPRAHTFSMGKDATTALRSFLRFALRIPPHGDQGFQPNVIADSSAT